MIYGSWKRIIHAIKNLAIQAFLSYTILQNAKLENTFILRYMLLKLCNKISWSSCYSVTTIANVSNRVSVKNSTIKAI